MATGVKDLAVQHEMRRSSGLANQPTTTGSDGVEEILTRGSSLDAAETGRVGSSNNHLHHHHHHHHRRRQKIQNETISGNSIDHQPRNGSSLHGFSSEKYGKKKASGTRFSLGTEIRRFLLNLRTRPRRALPTLVAILLGISLVISLAASVVVYSKIGIPENQGDPTTQIGVPQIHLSSLKIEFPIRLSIAEVKNVIRLPGALGPDEKEESYYIDFGGLNIEIFEEQGAARNIRHDYWLFETEYRFADEERDDDMEL